MRSAAWLLTALLAQGAAAATAYVSDELILGVYADPSGQGQRLATLHSGAAVEIQGSGGEYTQVRLSDGTAGWVKSSYLTTAMPATVRVKQLQEELDRVRATAPGLAEAAAHNEAADLARDLQSTRLQLETARAELKSHGAAMARGESPAPAGAGSKAGAWSVAAVLAAGLVGYWLGWGMLARRIRRKFGGLKIY